MRFYAPKAFDHACRVLIKTQPHSIIFGIDRISCATHLRAGNGVHRAYLEKKAILASRLKTFSDRLSPLHHNILKLEKHSFTHPALRLVFTNSEMVKQEILRFYPVDEKKIQVIHNGVEWDEFEGPFNAWQHQKQPLCHKLGLDPAHFHFLFVGHGFQRKGLSLLLDAFATLNESDCHLSIVGKDKHLSSFRVQCQRLGITNRVTFFGQQQDITPFYTVSDCLVIPSLYDPCANVTIEALAMGLYVVSSPFNGGAESLQQKTAVSFPTSSIKMPLLIP